MLRAIQGGVGALLLVWAVWPERAPSDTALASAAERAGPEALGAPPMRGDQAPARIAHRLAIDARGMYARVGDPFRYRPEVRRVPGRALRFTAENLPPWLSLNVEDGTLSGTPVAADAGVYENVVLAVADGAATSRSAPFSVTVVGTAATGSATLRWDMPQTRVDGAPLDDLAGYRILFGRDSANLDRSVLIDDPTITSFEFTELPSGIWYFAVVAVNAGGLEGPPTHVTMKSI